MGPGVTSVTGQHVGVTRPGRPGTLCTMTHDLSQRVALVTGASRGLGAAVALKLGACGARVAVNYFGSPDLADRVVARVRDAGGEAASFGADVTDERHVADLVASVAARFGPVDVLVL